MRIYECADYRAMSRQAANIISAQVIMKPECVKVYFYQQQEMER